MKFNWESNSCVFCESDIETVGHIFFQCEPINDISMLASTKRYIAAPISLSEMSIKAGI